MHGGSITGNNNDKGAGGVANTGTMQMYGGSITGNSSAASTGAVQTESESVIKLGGSSKITNNTSGSEGTACNLYLADGVTFTVDNSDDLYFKGKAGISTYDQDTLTGYDNILTISENALSSNTSPYSYFEADNVAYEMCKDGDGKLALRMARAAVSLDCSYGMDYNGTEQTGVREKTGYTLEGDAKATKPGDYTVTATLEEGYKWNDNSTDPKTHTWRINKRTAKTEDFIVTQKSAPYTGKAQAPTVSLIPIFTDKVSEGDLTVEYFDQKSYSYMKEVTDVGKYKVYVNLTEGEYFKKTSYKVYVGTFEITKADGPAAPECTFSFDGDNAGKLMEAVDGMEYSLDGGKNWTACTADMSVDTDNITSENGIQIRVKGTANVNAGEIQTISITEQAAPIVGKTDCTGKDVKGSLTGVSADMEYKLGADGAWTSITGNTVTGLEGGTYYVRCKASGTKLASPAQELVIEAYQLKTDKDITKFTIKGVVGTIDSENGTIAVDLPYAADTDITKLAPEITVSPLATVSPAGNAEQDFTNPVDYTVTAEDGSTKIYKVTVTVEQLKLTSVTAPEDKTLESFCETADAVIAALPDTVTVTTENPSITTLPCAWTCSSTYDKTPGAKNTFHWKANTNGCDVNGQTAEGDVTITNRAAIQLTVDTATLTKEKEYDGSNAINGTVAVNNITGIEKIDNVVVKADASYDSKAVGARTITVTYSLEGTDAWKYLPPVQQQQAGKIKQRPVNIIGLTAVERGYVKENCNVELTGGTIDNLISGEKVTIDRSTAKGTMTDDKAGEGKQVTVTGVNLSGDDAGNYVLSAQPTGVTVNIERASYTAGVSMGDYAYGSQASVPSVDNNPENGAVAYYYNTSNSNQNGLEWKNITNTAVPVGTYYMYAVIAQTDNYQSVRTAPVKFTVNGAEPKITEWPAISSTVYVNDAALTDESLTGGSAAVKGKFTITGETKSWSDSGEKQLEIIFTPDDNNYASVKHDITVNVIKRKVISVADSAAITDKTFKTEQNALGLPAKIEITISGNKKITVPVSWSGYDPETLDEQTLTGTLDLSEISAEVQQSENEVKASVKVKLQPIELGSVSFENKVAVYTGQPIEHKLGNITGVASVKYEYEGAGSTTYDKSESAPVNAGTYNVTATFTMTNGYAQLAPASASLTINKADGSVTSPTAIADIVYNGSAQMLINEAVSSTGEVQYKLGENGTYGVELPKAVNAGSYKVYFKVTGDNNHNDVAENSIDATVKKATVVITVNNKSAYVNDKAPDLSKPEADKDYTVSGLIGNEKLETAPVLKYTDAENKEIKDPDMTKAGTVTIGASGASAGDNYTVEYKTGTLTINNRRSSGGSTKYTVSAPKSTIGGSVKSDVSNAASGSTVNVTVIAEEGYKLDGLKVTDSKGNEIRITDKGNGKYTFTMPSDKVEITPVFIKEASEIVNELPFKDVAKGAYYYDAVKWAKDNGITGGVSNDMFGSNASCTRGHIVTFLWRNAGSPEPKSVSRFSDVALNSYYAKAVAWAVENGITNGVGQNKFDPDAVCTRAQSVAFLYRAIGKQAGSKAQFSDVPSNSYYADAVAWAAANDVTNGIGSGLFGSGMNCTRSQIVTFLYRAQQAHA